ncbi:hypothetical protein C8Q74DRAFT_830324 [Fomes fomentarius]|nr:hypothetical protein C8Q74DRAFT_830324 [Fomes fomentarius]
MRYGEIWLSTSNAQKTFPNDSLAKYFDTPDTFRYRILRNRVTLATSFFSAIRQQRMLTVDGGAAFLKYSTPEKNKEPWYVTLSRKVATWFTSAESMKRKEEYGKLVGALSKEVFGDKIHEMYEIIGLGTHPDFQGLGYGSALMRHVLEKSDAEGRDVWLVTTDAWRFYGYLGFTIAHSGVVGMNNPAWDGKPVTIRIMHRRAKRQS